MKVSTNPTEDSEIRLIELKCLELWYVIQAPVASHQVIGCWLPWEKGMQFWRRQLSLERWNFPGVPQKLTSSPWKTNGLFLGGEGGSVWVEHYSMHYSCLKKKKKRPVCMPNVYFVHCSYWISGSYYYYLLWRFREFFWGAHGITCTLSNNY